MKKKILITIGLLLFMNMLTWAFWGRDSILAIPAYEFKTAATCFADTVYVFTGLEDRPWYISQFMDFSPIAHKKFENAFNYKTFLLKFIDDTYQEGHHLLPEYLSYENTNYDFDIIRVIPLLAIVNKRAIAGDGSAFSSSTHIWFFRWWRLGNTPRRFSFL